MQSPVIRTLGVLIGILMSVCGSFIVFAYISCTISAQVRICPEGINPSVFGRIMITSLGCSLLLFGGMIVLSQIRNIFASKKNKYDSVNKDITP